MDPILEKLYGMNGAEIEAAKRHLMVSGGTLGPVLVKGNGVRVQDINGNTYIDCTAQMGPLSLGFANDEIGEVICKQVQTSLTHAQHGLDTLPRLYLARRLAELAPEGLDRVSFTVGGGAAVEAAMKIAFDSNARRS